MRQMTLSALGFTVALASPAPATAACNVEAPHEATVNAAGAKTVRVEARAGSLRVEGRPGTASVVVRGTACASESGLLEQIRLVAQRRDGTVHIQAVMPERDGWGFGRDYAALDLVVEVPEDIPLDIRDTSGDVTVDTVASAQIEDSSGGLRVRHVRGDLTVRDSSGELDIQDVGGMVGVRDTSGEITIRDVGDVIIESDGSGGIEIANVRGSVAIHDDGSGGIDVQNVGGDFTVGDAGSGGIRHRDVKGGVRIPGR